MGGMRRGRRLRLGLRIALFFFCLPRPRHSLVAISSVPPALVTEHLLPLPLLVFLSISSLVLFPISPSSPTCSTLSIHWNRTPQSRNQHRDPRSGKIRSNPVHTHGLSNYPSFILIQTDTLYFPSTPPRCVAGNRGNSTVLVTISDDLKIAIFFRLLTTYALPPLQRLHRRVEESMPLPLKRGSKRYSSPTLG
jgi:hypothetical protein